jgi:hypothetical protein
LRTPERCTQPPRSPERCSNRDQSESSRVWSPSRWLQTQLSESERLHSAQIGSFPSSSPFRGWTSLCLATRCVLKGVRPGMEAEARPPGQAPALPLPGRRVQIQAAAGQVESVRGYHSGQNTSRDRAGGSWREPGKERLVSARLPSARLSSPPLSSAQLQGPERPPGQARPPSVVQAGSA